LLNNAFKASYTSTLQPVSYHTDITNITNTCNYPAIFHLNETASKNLPAQKTEVPTIHNRIKLKLNLKKKTEIEKSKLKRTAELIK